MKCISLWQPFASLIAIGAKRIETRSWPCSYVGPLAIHAAKKMNRELLDLALTPPFSTCLRDAGLLPSDLPLGGVVAICRLSGCKRTDKVQPDEPERSFGDYSAGRFAWLLDDITALTQPVPWKGSQGFFEVPDDLILAKA